MIRHKIAAYIFGTKKNYYSATVILLPHDFEVFSDSASYLYLVIAKFDNCSFYDH